MWQSPLKNRGDCFAALEMALIKKQAFRPVQNARGFRFLHLG
jgi:hypothetical protein